MIPQPSCFEKISKTDKQEVKKLCISFCKSKNYLLKETSNFLLILRTSGYIEDHSLTEDEYNSTSTDFSCESIRNKYSCTIICTICPHGNNINSNKIHEENVLAYLIQNSNMSKTINNLSENHFKSVIYENDAIFNVLKALYTLLPLSNTNINIKLKNLIKDNDIFNIAMNQYEVLENRKIDRELFNQSLSSVLENHESSNDHISENLDEPGPKKVIKQETFVPFSETDINDLQSIVQINDTSETENKTEIKDADRSKEDNSLHNSNIVSLDLKNDDMPILFSSSVDTEDENEHKKIEVDETTPIENTDSTDIVNINESSTAENPDSSLVDKYELVDDYNVYKEQIHNSLFCCKALYLDYYPTNEELLYVHYEDECKKYYYKLSLKNKDILKKLACVLANEFITKVSYSFIYLQYKFKPYKIYFKNCFDIKLAYTLVNPKNPNNLANIIKHFTHHKKIADNIDPIINITFAIPLYNVIYKKLKNDIKYNNLKEKYDNELLFNYYQGASLSVPLEHAEIIKPLTLNHYSFDYLHLNNIDKEKLLSMVPKNYKLIECKYTNTDITIDSDNTLLQDLYRYVIIEILKNKDIWYCDVFMLTCNKDGILLAFKNSLKNVVFDALNQSMSMNYKKLIKKDYPNISISLF